MRKIRWTKWAAALLGGAILLQAPSCTDTATFVTALSSVASAVGVLYLVRRVIH